MMIVLNSHNISFRFILFTITIFQVKLTRKEEIIPRPWNFFWNHIHSTLDCDCKAIKNETTLLFCSHSAHFPHTLKYTYIKSGIKYNSNNKKAKLIIALLWSFEYKQNCILNKNDFYEFAYLLSSDESKECYVSVVK